MATATRVPSLAGAASSRDPAQSREVRRPDHPVGAGEPDNDLAAPPRVVAERDHVDARREQPVGDPRSEPDPVGRVLAVGNDEVDVELVAQGRQPLLDRAVSRRAVDVGDEED